MHNRHPKCYPAARMRLRGPRSVGWMTRSLPLGDRRSPGLKTCITSLMQRAIKEVSFLHGITWGSEWTKARSELYPEWVALRPSSRASLWTYRYVERQRAPNCSMSSNRGKRTSSICLHHVRPGERETGGPSVTCVGVLLVP